MNHRLSKWLKIVLYTIYKYMMYDTSKHYVDVSASLLIRIVFNIAFDFDIQFRSNVNLIQYY